MILLNRIRILLLVAFLVELATISPALAQSQSPNMFAQKGVELLVIKNNYPVEVFIAVDGVWQGRVPAKTVAYMPVEGYVTKDSGFDAEGNLTITHAFGGFGVSDTMELRYVSQGYRVRDPEDSSVSYETYVDGRGTMRASDANSRGFLGHIVGPPFDNITDLEFERMAKFIEGEPRGDWQALATKAGPPRELSGEEAATQANAGSSAPGTVIVYGGIPGVPGNGGNTLVGVFQRVYWTKDKEEPFWLELLEFSKEGTFTWMKAHGDNGRMIAGAKRNEVKERALLFHFCDAIFRVKEFLDGSYTFEDGKLVLSGDTRVGSPAGTTIFTPGRPTFAELIPRLDQSMKKSKSKYDRNFVIESMVEIYEESLKFEFLSLTGYEAGCQRELANSLQDKYISGDGVYYRVLPTD